MRLFTYGDSWTEGVGGNIEEEIKTDVPEERTIIRQKYCWPTHLSDLLNCGFQNNGVGGFSNNAIFNTIHHNLKNGIINQDDFVVIMWSSSLRDSLPFFPNEDDFFIWGKRYKSKNHLFKHIFGGGKGNLYTKKEYGDFHMKFEFQLTPGANNGLGIRAPLEGDAAYVGMELQILDNTAPIYAKLQPYQYHGSVYGIIAAKQGFSKPVGEWNQQEVIAVGNKIKVILNGEVILDGDIAEATKAGTADHKEHPGLLNKTGHIGFLGHGDSLRFRNLRIKDIVEPILPVKKKKKS